ncbi:hypothetical protein IQ274_13910 [Nostoc sp. LEGE 12447]|uniref:hypothetical protein n=1 Tax=Nostoc sp. LEGE 12447 TaxID=1828640 RepID=UPI00188334DE|nr:hypothetical protein [Nostoc sp. LEGE 12447]MBE8999284.1 hypothetical protein [Nostoc sp. LEGE 12447]
MGNRIKAFPLPIPFYLLPNRLTLEIAIQKIQVKQAVRQVHTEGIYPSEVAISRLLVKPGCFPDKKVRAALRATRREIYLEP